MEIKEKLKIPYPILVEGKYDRLRLLSVLDAQIITTDGFGIFNKKEKTSLLRALAKAGQIIVLTDSDGAGKLIRSHVSGCLPKESVINLYTPEIFGKEKRKAEPSAEGKLGVEGMERELLYNLFLPGYRHHRICRLHNTLLCDIPRITCGNNSLRFSIVGNCGKHCFCNVKSKCRVHSNKAGLININDESEVIVHAHLVDSIFYCGFNRRKQ